MWRNISSTRRFNDISSQIFNLSHRQEDIQKCPDPCPSCHSWELEQGADEHRRCGDGRETGCKRPGGGRNGKCSYLDGYVPKVRDGIAARTGVQTVTSRRLGEKKFEECGVVLSTLPYINSILFY